MLASSPVVAFAATAQPAESRTFYEGVLGLACRADEPAALVFAGANATIRVAKLPLVEPPAYTVLGWEVEDIEESVAQLSAAGVACTSYDDLDQDEHGVTSFDDGTRVAWFEDPDGNTLSVTQHPPAA